MPRTALFTGAGASKAIGYPLTWELLPLVRQGLANGTLFRDTMGREEAKSGRDELAGYLMRLLPGLNAIEREDQLPLITDVFSLVEYSIHSGEALAIGADETLRRCRYLLKLAMTDVFLENFNRDYDQDVPAEKEEQEVRDRLIGWIKKQGKNLGLVTTNYDIGIDYEYYEVNGYQLDTVDLGFDFLDEDGDQHTRPRDPAFRMYKLHGSFNLLRCSNCGYVYFNPDGSIAHQVFRKTLDRNNTCHCSKEIRLDLQIVPPSMVRDVRDANLLSIWRSAVDWMRQCPRWIIVGYSLPPEDLAIRSLLLRAYQAAEEKPEVIVVQDGHKAERHYKLLFPKATYHPDGLESFLERL